jgi:CBS domain-containing protein
MRDEDIGDVIVMDDGKVCGIVTDRDVVVRALAEDRDPKSTKVAEICSRDLTTIAPGDPIDKAVKLMRERSIRRLPVVQGDRPVGIVSIGDLAQDRDPESALADISAAPPNN